MTSEMVITDSTPLNTSLYDVISPDDVITAVTESHVVSISNQNFILSVLYYVIGSIGLVGNLLVVVVIFQYTQMRRVLTNIYVINQVITNSHTTIVLSCLCYSYWKNPEETS